MILKARIERFCPYCQTTLWWDIWHNGNGKEFWLKVRHKLFLLKMHRELCSAYYVYKQTVGVEK
jgi:hypothetical protein